MLSRLIAALLIAGTLSLAGCGTQQPEARKNLVLVCIDAVRFDSFFLPERSGMEDRLSARLDRALVYTKAHTAAPWTVPSVVSVFTGLYPAQHGAGRFGKPVANLGEDIPSRLPEEATTLAERLRDAGFRTGAFTSHPWFRSGYGMEQGFEELHLRKNPSKLLDKGFEWLDGGGGRHFFMYLHFMAAHDNHLKVDRLDEFMKETDPAVLAAARERAPAGVCDREQSLMCRRFQVYSAKVMEERASLARLLDELESRRLLADTAVVVFSDHGEAFNDHEKAAEALAADPRGFYGFGHGQSLYQELLHVPLLAWHPDIPGQPVGDVVSLVDVAPTMLAWAGVEAPASAFAGRVAGGWRKSGVTPFRWSDYDPTRWPDMDRRIFASGIAYGPEQIAVLEDGWKYVWHEADGRSQLFNLHEDPAERHPLDDPERIAALEPALDRYFDWTTEERFEAPDLNDEQVEQLKGVGYLQGRETGSGTKDPDAPADDRSNPDSP